VGWLRAVGSAAALALARVLAFAAVIARLTTALSLAIVLAFAGMCVTLLIILLRQQQTSARRRLACGVLSCRGVRAGESWRAGAEESGYGSG
jgi:hypothetical protein